MSLRNMYFISYDTKLIQKTKKQNHNGKSCEEYKRDQVDHINSRTDKCRKFSKFCVGFIRLKYNIMFLQHL